MTADFGADALRFRTTGGHAWVVSSASRIPAELRRTALAGRSKDFRYYELLEESLRTQFDYRHFVLHDEATGEWAIQPCFFVNQDLLAGLPQAIRSLFSPVRKLWPRFLTLRMLMIGEKSERMVCGSPARRSWLTKKHGWIAHSPEASSCSTK